MKLYVTGERGQLGQCLIGLGAMPLGAKTPDPWDVVINAAALTDHNKCIEDPDDAWRSNVELPRALAKMCKINSARLIHISTDYVFNHYDPSHRFKSVDPTNPVRFNTYAQTKLAGELAVQTVGGKFNIVRTSWLLSPLRKANWLDMPFVWNQIGTLTWAPMLASALVHLAHDMSHDPSAIMHFTSSYSSSRSILASVSQGQLVPLASIQCPMDRPFNSSLKPDEYFSKFIMTPEEVIHAYRESFPYQKPNI